MYQWKFTVMLALCCLARMANTGSMALAFSAPRFPHNLRYPVGYNPDNRTRPNYHNYPVELLLPDSPAMPEFLDRCSENTCSPMELKARPKWVPPEAYNPKRRRSSGTAFQTPPLQRTDEDNAKNARLETVDWENDYDAEDKIRLCTGIWMGRKILHKRCVTLDPSDKMGDNTEDNIDDNPEDNDDTYSWRV